MKIEWNNITKIKTSNRLYKKRIAELEKGRDAYMVYYVDAKRWFDRHDPNGYVSPSQDKCKAILQAHNLRQQANALHWILSSNSGIELSVSACHKLFERMADINKQADELEKPHANTLKPFK